MEKLFKLKEYGTNVRTEIIAGLTTFFTMAYIIIVNPSVLSQTGMDKNGVFIATIIAAVAGTLIMAFVANVPYAQAPGMGLNAFFTFTVCFALKFTWQQALAMVFICGLINITITVTQVRKMIIKAIPKSIQNAIGGGIGMFIAYIGVKDAGLLKFTSDPGTYTKLSGGTIVANSSAVPALVNFHDPATTLAVIGIAIMVVFVVLKVPGSILLGIVATTAIGLIETLCGLNVGIDLSSVDISGKAIAGSIGAISNTAFKLDFAGLGGNMSRVLLVITTILAFSLSDTFDTIGTFIGTGRKSGIFSDAEEEELYNGKGFKTRMDRALFADSTATSIGALFGTSNTTTYVESASGIGAGGRTGMTSLVVAILFALCIPLSPLLALIPTAATAPALIVVGIMMMSSFKEIDWSDFEVAAPAFITAVFMPFAYGITTGMAAGFIFYVLIKVVKGKFKEVHPIMYIATGLFLLNYVILALRNI